MNARTREIAEKITNIVYLQVDCDGTWISKEKAIEDVAAAIDEAVLVELAKVPSREDFYSQGFAAAKAGAVEIAQSHIGDGEGVTHHHCEVEIATRIKEMKP